MTAPLLGAPVGPDSHAPATARTFNGIPHLRELLPNGGWPGVVYALVCVHNIARAKARVEKPANLRTIRGTENEFFAIEGPRGRASMALLGCGVPIPGASPEAGDRLCFTDGEVETLTGHVPKYPIWFRPQPEVTDGEKEPSAPRANPVKQGVK